MIPENAPNNWGDWRPRRRRRWLASQDGRMPGSGMDAPRTSVGANGGTPPTAPGFPTTPPAPPSFLPMTANFEASRRQLEDQLAATQSAYSTGVEQIPATLKLQTERAGTDVGYQTDRQNEDLAGRGVYDSGIRPYLYQRDISIPYGRHLQDLGLAADQQYSDLASSLGNAGLQYNQGLMEALLQRASDAASQMPLSLPQSGYTLPTQSSRTTNSRRDRRRRRNRNR